MNGKDYGNFTEERLKKFLINFDRLHDENQKLRIKYYDSPTKFAASETELFASLDELQGIATQPELYPVLVSRGTFSSMISLITHENTDISSKVIGIIHELTDTDDSDEQESIEVLVEGLLKEKIIELIVSNLSRFDTKSKDESYAIINSLGIIDNLIDFRAEIAQSGCKDIVNWMVKTLSETDEFNPIKLSISELLSVLLLSSNENKLHFNECNGMDVLLRQVAYYRRIAPQTGDEHEFLEQTINCLCTAVFDCDANRESFFKEEGVDLVELILREKRDAIKKSNLKLSTLKLFNHVLTTDKNEDKLVTQCCERFVEVLGLRVIFPLFNNPKLVLNDKVKKREYHQFIDEVEEHSSAILLALLKNSQNAGHIQRILVKFAEMNFEKMLRLLKLHDKYFSIVQNEDPDNQSRNDQSALSSSYFTLRTIDYIILLVAYLTNQYETYDPTSGETFASFFTKTLKQRPQLRHQLVLETRRHIDEVSDSEQERESLNFLMKHFENIGKSNQDVAAH